MGKITDRIKFLTESRDSEDFGKEWDDWKASKEQEKAANDGSDRKGK